MRKTLDPCPFCGADVAYLPDFIADGELISVRCGNCGGRGGDWRDRDRAVNAWNRRPEVCQPGPGNTPGDPCAVDTYIHGLGTIRACLDCSALVAGGPTRCGRCTREACGLCGEGMGRHADECKNRPLTVEDFPARTWVAAPAAAVDPEKSWTHVKWPSAPLSEALREVIATAKRGSPRAGEASDV